LSAVSSVVALVVGGALFAVPGSASADQSPGGPKDTVPTATCKRIYNLTNVLLRQQVVIPPGSGPQVGTDTIYHDELLDANGNYVGKSDGRITLISQRPSDGHIIAYEDQQLTIDGGVFHVTGLLDASDLLGNGSWGHLQATGVSGADKGWIGDWQFRVVTPTVEPFLWQADSQFDLCKISK
jgi:hypothetical protein